MTQSQRPLIPYVSNEPGVLRSFSADEFVFLDLPKRKRIVGTWLRNGSINLIHAKRGVGKSELVLWMAYCIATGTEFLDWKVDEPRNVIVLDGEMHAAELKRRIKRIARTLGPCEDRLQVVSAMLTEPPVPDLSTDQGREALTRIIGAADVVVLDNLAAWDRSGREDAESWSRLVPWFQGLVRTGVAIVVVHHSGKNGTQRGSSRHEDMMDTVINVTKPPGSPANEPVNFEMHFTKVRHTTKGVHSRKVALKEGADGTWDWASETIEAGASWHAEALRLNRAGKGASEIARKLGKHKSSVSRLLRGRR